MLDDINELLDDAIGAHKAKDFNSAAVKYKKILEHDAHHADANHNFGVLTVELGFNDDALIFLQTAINTNPSVLQYWVTFVDTLINADRFDDARSVLEEAYLFGYRDEVFDHLRHNLDLKQQEIDTSIKYDSIDHVQDLSEQVEISNEDARGANEISNGILGSTDNAVQVTDIPQDELKSLMNLFGQQKFEQVFRGTQQLTKKYSNNVTLWNLMGVAAIQIGQSDSAVLAFKNAINVNPSSADAHNNLGNILQEQGKLEEAIDAYKKVLSIEPNSASALNNMGVALKDQGKLEEAVEAYNKAISLEPDYAEAFNNLGIALKDQGKLEEAVEAYNKAISLKPDYAKAYRNLSSINEYSHDDTRLTQVERLISSQGITDHGRCDLSFALAKMYEDEGKLAVAFKYLSEGNALRKRILNYSIDRDKELFEELIKAQPQLKKSSLATKEGLTEPTPIFILGMPRSGTTLVEQIISSHSEVTGAGELSFVSQYGHSLAIGSKAPSEVRIKQFREKYLSSIVNYAKGNKFFTDKMPHNFRFIPLICAAFPEAKIVHVQRDAGAVCWSNYKQYFVSSSIGYCYDLEDVTAYYELYKDLMEFWQSEYNDRIYNLHYEQLTVEQEKETKKLIKHLKIDWDEACLSPHENKRSVRTASQQQVRKKVYQGSSKAWRKYEPYLNGAFDCFTA